jgi:geranylgeranyl diphosphate synthase type I
MADAGVPSERVLDAVRILDDACIALCEGQHADLSFESRPAVTPDEYQSMIAGKTSALLGAAAAIGAVAGGADRATADAFAASGILLGLAFQAQDDVLGIWGDEGLTGKPVAADIRSRKKSFPVVHAFRELDAAKRAELDRIYAGDSLAEHDITRVLELLEVAGARAAATSASELWAAAAIEKLRPLRLVAGSRADIEALASYFVHRSA